MPLRYNKREGQMEGEMKEKNEAEERAMKYLQEKDELKIMAQKTQEAF